MGRKVRRVFSSLLQALQSLKNRHLKEIDYSIQKVKTISEDVAQKCYWTRNSRSESLFRPEDQKVKLTFVKECYWIINSTNRRKTKDVKVGPKDLHDQICCLYSSKSTLNKLSKSLESTPKVRVQSF